MLRLYRDDPGSGTMSQIRGDGVAVRSNPPRPDGIRRTWIRLAVLSHSRQPNLISLLGLNGPMGYCDSPRYASGLAGGGPRETCPSPVTASVSPLVLRATHRGVGAILLEAETESNDIEVI